jgi:GntR family transcriptional repressor for pyruvate dehydrogenase complex
MMAMESVTESSDAGHVDEDDRASRNLRREHEDEGMTMIRIQPAKGHEVVAEHIIERIRSGEWAPGQKLPNLVELAASYGIGRTTIREAISALKATGWLQVRHGSGTYISEVLPEPDRGGTVTLFRDAESLREILEVRKVLETGSAMLAAEKRTEADLTHMRQILKRMEDSLIGHDTELGEQADVEFHLAIAQASQNKLMAQLMDSLAQQLNATIRETRLIWFYQEEQTAAALLEEHRRIYQRIAERDALGARDAIFEHLTKVEQKLKQATAREG